MEKTDKLVFLDRARWVTDKYILVMLGLFPLFVGVRLHAYESITAAKFWFFIAATGVWAVAVLALLLAGRLTGERYCVEVRPTHLAVAAFLAVSGVSACLSEYGSLCLMGGNRYDGYLMYLLYGVVFFGVSWLGAPRTRYVWAMGLSAAVCCAIALLQLTGLDPLWLYPAGTDYYDQYVAYNGAFLGTIGNVGLLAAYLCLACPMLAVYAVLSKSRRDRLLLVPAALSLAVLALCDVDAGIVAAAGCVLVAVPVVIQNNKIAARAGCVSGAAAVSGLAALYFWPGDSGLLYELSQVLHGHLADEFGSHRGQIWKRCWQLFLERPWLGAGPGTSSKRIDIQWSRLIEETGVLRTVSVTNTHNVYLGYLLCTGALGLLAYVAAMGCSFVTWLRRRRDGAVYPALGSALLCYMIQDFFGLGLVITAPMLWVVWGLLESRDYTALDANPSAENGMTDSGVSG